MKAKILMLGLAFSIILFIDYFLLVVIGCTACAVGAEENFYCIVFCNFARILIVLTTFFPFGIAAYRSINTNKL